MNDPKTPREVEYRHFHDEWCPPDCMMEVPSGMDSPPPQAQNLSNVFFHLPNCSCSTEGAPFDNKRDPECEKWTNIMHRWVRSIRASAWDEGERAGATNERAKWYWQARNTAALIAMRFPAERPPAVPPNPYQPEEN